MKHVKKVKPQPENRPNAPTADKTTVENSDKSARRPILYARPCIPVDGN